MISLLLSLLTFSGLGPSPARATLQNEILGRWSYDGFQFEGVRYPKPNPDLTLTLTFRPDGTNTLFWQRANESEFCERVAEYSVREEILFQKVTWVNPANGRECAGDPDMRSGLETETRISILGPELWLHLEMNGKPFYYILIISSEDGSTPAPHPQAPSARPAPSLRNFRSSE